MRIIGGKYKSRLIRIPSKLKARPTTDFARENLFNILNNLVYWEDTVALDLFSGTGSIAFELVSRGCKRVVSIEKNSLNHKFICDNKDMLEAKELLPLRADSFKFLASNREKYDLIFADPPYYMEEINAIPDIIFNNDMLNEDGIFILEHSMDHDFSEHPRFWQQKKYGSVHFSMFQ